MLSSFKLCWLSESGNCDLSSCRRESAVCQGSFGLFIGVCPIVRNDIMHSNDIIVTFLIHMLPPVHVGKFCVIAKKFSNAMDERDAASQELLSTYQQLDDELLRRETQSRHEQLERDNEIAAQQLIQADKLATMGTMVAGVAHDIANPTGLIKEPKS